MTYQSDPTPLPDNLPPVSKGQLFIQISVLHEQYLGLASGYLKPSSDHRTARQEMADILSEIKGLYQQIGRMK